MATVKHYDFDAGITVGEMFNILCREEYDIIDDWVLDDANGVLHVVVINPED